jgi:iron complex outermembrane receptor protein
MRHTFNPKPVRSIRRLALAATALVALGGTAAHAEAAATSEVSAGDASVAVDEVLVTARRRAEDPQKVPIPLSVFGGAQLDKQNVYSLDQLQRQAPSLQVIATNPRNSNINIRGLGSNIGLANDGLENGVGVYVDDVYYARTAQALFDVIDLERIEVLRGPQGTLFGKNTTAGAISIYTRPPSFTPNVSGSVSGGEHGYRQFTGAVGGPIIADKLAARLTVGATHHDGFITDVHDGRKLNAYDNLTLRGQALATLSQNLSLKISGDYGRQAENGFISSPLGYVTQRSISGAAPTPIPNFFTDRAARLGYTPLPIDPFARRVDIDAEQRIAMHQWGTSVKVDWTTPVGALTAITAYRSWSWAPHNDPDATPLQVYSAANNTSEQRQFTQEIRLASTGERKLDYVVGAFYYRQTLRSNNIIGYGRDAPLFLEPADTATNRTNYTAALDGFNVVGDSGLVSKSYAGFGQLTWHATDRLSVTGGLRYTKERKGGYFNQIQTGGADLASLPAAVATAAQAIRNGFGSVRAYTASTREDKFAGQVNIAYKLADDVQVYATYARGFKSGGLSLTNLAPGIPTTIEPERVANYEAGLKSQFLDRRVTLNLAVFNTTVANYQATLLDPVRTTTYISNVGKVRSRGVEVESRYDPFDGLNLYASASFLNAKYLSFHTSPCPIEQLGTPVCDFSGQYLTGAPKFSAGAGGEYSFAVANNARGYVGADYTYRSSINPVANSTRIPGYALVNARLGVRLDGERIDVSLWARNLFNKDYLVSKGPAAFNSGLLTGLLGDPRIIGATVRVNY